MYVRLIKQNQERKLLFKVMEGQLILKSLLFCRNFLLGINLLSWQDHYNIEFLVSKETVVLRRWERSKQKFGFIKRVDKG